MYGVYSLGRLDNPKPGFMSKQALPILPLAHRTSIPPTPTRTTGGMPNMYPGRPKTPSSIPLQVGLLFPAFSPTQFPPNITHTTSGTPSTLPTSTKDSSLTSFTSELYPPVPPYVKFASNNAYHRWYTDYIIQGDENSGECSTSSANKPTAFSAPRCVSSACHHTYHR